ncbi:hypothetical protein B0H17DRAFT_1135158 [Mycena rosella]|uniref:Uncharacterized protein n=1 Tax=Mycena rosella TaxID=1033263 RepID=A0AAD7DDW6_MYCRO|nr:hypothetical protein B0H17DRAFT_1135158 [Mycena rosella]
MVNASVPLSPMKRSANSLPIRTMAEGTWIYDFMDKNWSFPTDNAPPQSEDEGDTNSLQHPPASRIQSLRCNGSYEPIRKWKEGYRWTWLNEILRLEGQGDHAAHPTCEGFATECVVRDHARHPLHRLETCR